MMLIPDSGIFYEFIPLSETDKEFPETVAIDGVEKARPTNWSYRRATACGATAWATP